MAYWKKIITDNQVSGNTSLGTSNDVVPTQAAVKSYVDNNIPSKDREFVCMTANSRSGYKSGSGSNFRHFWAVPSSWYGIRRNNRGNHLSSSSGEPAIPDYGSLPASISTSTPMDNMFEYGVKATTNHKFKVSWHSSSNQIWQNDSIIYFAPIIILPDDYNRWTNHNFTAISKSDWTFLFPTGYDGTSTTRGIVKADLGTITGLTSNDATYNFAFEWSIDTELTIPMGSHILILVTNDQATSSSTSEYMRNLTCVLECEAT
tara:strand:+ start:4219 stop:5001 length:783 start_codon:yes stop_codon:yes gene_type:complete